MYVVCYKDADGFVLPCVDISYNNVLVFETQLLAEEALEEHKENLQWLLGNEVITKRTWWGRKYTIQAPRQVANRQRRIREQVTLFVKKGRLLIL